MTEVPSRNCPGNLPGYMMALPFALFSVRHVASFSRGITDTAVEATCVCGASGSIAQGVVPSAQFCLRSVR
jgi:hypothetical protein